MLRTLSGTLLRLSLYRKKFLGLIGRQSGPSTMHAPGADEHIGKLAAGFDEEGGAALRVTAQGSGSTPSQRAGKS